MPNQLNNRQYNYLENRDSSFYVATQRNTLRDASISQLSLRYFFPLPICMLTAIGIGYCSFLLSLRIPLDPLFSLLVLGVINQAVWLSILLVFRRKTSFKRTIILFLVSLLFAYVVYSCALGVFFMIFSRDLIPVAFILGSLLVLVFFYLCRIFKFIDANATYLFSLGMVNITTIFISAIILVALLFKITGEYFI